MLGWLVVLLEAADSYLLTKRSLAQVVTETKTRVWEEFCEAMKKDFQSKRQRNSGKRSSGSGGESRSPSTQYTVREGR